MALWFLRHAQPLVPQGTCYGKTDMPADPVATQMAAQGIADHLPAGLHIVCSPLQRCRELSAAVQALRPDLSMTIDHDLSEMDFGAWEGRLWADLGPQTLGPWTDNFADHVTGDHGESVRMFMGRVAMALARWKPMVVEQQTPVLWIAHAGVERATRLLAQGITCPQTGRDWPKSGLGFGEWARISLS